jgi:formylglycine-generating enzyme required for sulfatase activity
LPTEAEWEYACRAGTTTARWWGEAAAGAQGRASVLDPASKAKFGVSWEAFGFDDGYRTSAPVGTFAPNGWGLCDMLGNVWEWCADWYGDYPAGRVQDPPGPSSSSEGRRVVRGGSWGFDPDFVRSAGRLRDAPDFRDVNLGFRVVLGSPLK